jgi:oligoribonuclease
MSDATTPTGNLLWLDLEMTGLDPESCVIIEVAAVVTDAAFAPLADFEAVVFQPPEALAAMDEWNTRTHGQSGLTERIPHGRPLAEVEDDLLALVRANFATGERPVLCGNSIGQDRKFIDRYMPRFAEALHYRMIDVSSFKEMLGRRGVASFRKQQTHRALDDVGESIDELAHYLGFFSLDAAERSGAADEASPQP